jgi:hypothetical protein
MELVAAVGGGAFVLASLVLGARLMLLARRTRGAPELILGFGLFLMGGLGYPLMAVAQHGNGLELDVRIGLIVTQMLFSALGMTGVTLFTRRVFRPQEAWAAWTTPLCAGSYLALFLAQALGPGFEETLAAKGVWYNSTLIGISVMAWTGWESLRYHGMMRRRQLLGLADPAVVDRFRLWAISMFTATTISVVGYLLQRIFGIALNGTTAGHLLVGPLGLVVAIALWLAFLPPAGYLERVRRRSSLTAAAA